MLKNFKTYQLSLAFHKSCIDHEGIPSHLRDQLFRASSSVCLNLAEGSAKATRKDQAKFYFIAMGSLRESQACLEFLPNSEDLKEIADEVGAALYSLIKSTLHSKSKFFKGGF